MRKLTEIADQGDNLAMLRALRHRLADAIDNTTSGRDIASLARQLQIVSAQIAAIEEQQCDDPISDILKDREDRGELGSVRRSMLRESNNDENDE